MLRLAPKAHRLLVPQRFFAENRHFQNTNRDRRSYRDVKSPLDQMQARPAMIKEEKQAYELGFYKNAPITGFVVGGREKTSTFQQLSEHLRNGKLTENDLLFIDSWKQSLLSKQEFKEQIHAYLAGMSDTLRDADIKLTPESAASLLLALASYLSYEYEALNQLVKSLGFDELPAKAQVRVIDKILREIEENADAASLETLAGHISVFTLLHDKAISGNLLKHYSAGYLKEISDKMMRRFIKSSHSEDLRTMYGNFAQLVSKVTANNDISFEDYFSVPELLLFTVYYYSSRIYSIDVKYELSDLAVDKLVHYYDKARSGGEFKSLVSLIFEEEYVRNDIANLKAEQFESITKEFGDQLEVFKKFRKRVSNVPDSHLLSLYINSNFACGSNQLEYFIVNEENLAKHPKSLMHGKIMFNYLVTVLQSLEHKKQFEHFKDSFAQEYSQLVDTDKGIIDVVIDSKLGDKNASNRYLNLVIEPMAKARLKHKLLIALKGTALEVDQLNTNIRADIIDKFMKNLENNKQLKNQLFYKTDTPQGLAQGLVSFFKVTEFNYDDSLSMGKEHLEMERATDKFFSLAARDQTTLRDGRVIRKELFDEYIKDVMVPHCIVSRRGQGPVEEDDDDEDDDDAFPQSTFITDRELKYQKYPFLQRFIDKNLFQLDFKIENNIDRPIETIKEEHLNEQVLARFWNWVLKNVNYKDFNGAANFYIKDHRTRSLAEKIAELSLKTDNINLKTLSLSYLDISRGKFDSKRLQEDIESIGYIDNGVFYKAGEANDARKAQLVHKSNLYAIDEDQLSQELRQVMNVCKSAKDKIKEMNL